MEAEPNASELQQGAFTCVSVCLLSNSISYPIFTAVPAHQLSKLLMIFAELEWHPGVYFQGVAVPGVRWQLGV